MSIDVEEPLQTITTPETFVLPSCRAAHTAGEAFRAACAALDALNGITPRDKYIQLISRVCQNHDVTVKEVFGISRQREVVQCRWECFSKLKSEYGLTITQIGRLFHKDHTTVLHGLKRIKRIKNA